MTKAKIKQKTEPKWQPLELVPAKPPPNSQIPETPTSLHKLPKPSRLSSVKSALKSHDDHVVANLTSNDVFELPATDSPQELAQPKPINRIRNTFTSRKFAKPKTKAPARPAKPQKLASESAPAPARVNPGEQASARTARAQKHETGTDTNKDLDIDAIKKPAIIHFSQDGPKNQGVVRKTSEGAKRRGLVGAKESVAGQSPRDKKASEEGDHLNRAIGLFEETHDFQYLDNIMNEAFEGAQTHEIMHAQSSGQTHNQILSLEERQVNGTSFITTNKPVTQVEDSLKHAIVEDSSKQIIDISSSSDQFSSPPESLHPLEIEQEDAQLPKESAWEALADPLIQNPPVQTQELQSAKALAGSRYGTQNKPPEVEKQMEEQHIAGPVPRPPYQPPAIHTAQLLENTHAQTTRLARQKRARAEAEAPKPDDQNEQTSDFDRGLNGKRIAIRSSSSAGNATPCPSPKTRKGEGRLLQKNKRPEKTKQSAVARSVRTRTRDSDTVKVAADNSDRRGDTVDISNALPLAFPTFHTDVNLKEDRANDVSEGRPACAPVKTTLVDTLAKEVGEAREYIKKMEEFSDRSADESVVPRPVKKGKSLLKKSKGVSFERMSVSSDSSNSSASSFTTAEATQTQELTDEMEWEASLRPELRSILDILRRLTDASPPALLPSSPVITTAAY